MTPLFILKSQIANYFGTTPEEMSLKDRHQNIKLARQIFVVLASEQTIFCPDIIAKEVGLTRGQFYHSKKAINNLLHTDKRFAGMFNHIQRTIKYDNSGKGT